MNVTKSEVMRRGGDEGLGGAEEVLNGETLEQRLRGKGNKGFKL